MVQVLYFPDALAQEFSLFCDDIRSIDAWKTLFSDGIAVAGLRIQPSRWNRDDDDVIRVAQKIICGTTASTDSSLLLFLAHAPWQPNSRVVRYRRIWGDEFFRSCPLPPFSRGTEIARVSGAGIRYASTLNVDSDLFSVAAHILLSDMFASFFVVSRLNRPVDKSIEELFDAAFGRDADGTPGTHVNWGSLIHRSAANHEIIVKRSEAVGELRGAIDLFGNATDCSANFELCAT